MIELRDDIAEAHGAFWDQFARRYGREVSRCVALAMRRAGWRPQAPDIDELVQEVYCRVLAARPAVPLTAWPPAQVWSYLHRIARSVVIDELRSRGARKRGGGHGAAGPAACDRRAPGPTPEERLLARERAADLRRRVRSLGEEHGPRNLRILELSAIEGCTAAEISRHLAGALTPSSVHTVLHRLRRQLTMPPLAVTGAISG
ncbi:MAG TPA: sigma-70 family RNA polymerase sigma factor [Thermoanaerobaculia bacterium]|jgi:RNA polymerase sigma factor (sigma-70 family)|nr:sigma-70 family RNA polymerase sigma factor [Thermoanaerobaculia bacterium]